MVIELQVERQIALPVVVGVIVAPVIMTTTVDIHHNPILHLEVVVREVAVQEVEV